METELVSLLIISGIAFACPIIASLVPNKLIPETVFLLVFGMILGPHVVGVVEVGDAISLLSELGLSFLFLLAGYEIDPRKLGNAQGRHGLATWIISFAITFVIVFFLPDFDEHPIMYIAIAIALTTTAFGTVVPILHERGLVGTQVGDAVVAYGTWGELCPIIVIALLLSSRSIWITGVILLAFTLIAVLTVVIPKRLREKNSSIENFILRNADTNAQMTVRAVVFLLMALVAVSALFGLDIVLGSFAAGFALRAIIPHGSEGLEKKLQSIGYGFFIPLFFVVSGTKIDPAAVVQSPLILVVFILLLILMRAMPIYISLSITKDGKSMTPRIKATLALYCTTALPLIVAVTSVATASGAMSQSMASVLISAGGITVFLMPLLASIALHTIDAEMGGALKNISKHPTKTLKILKQHHEIEKTGRKERKHVLSKNPYLKAKRAPSKRSHQQ